MESYRMLIDGKLVDAESGETFEVVDPCTEEPIAMVPSGSRGDVRRAAAAARRAFDRTNWPTLDQDARIRLLLDLADRLEAKAEMLVELETRQSGIPIRKTTLMDIPVGIEMFRTMVRASAFPRYEPLPWIDFPAVSWNFVHRGPIGVCGAISAWNFPFLFTMWKAAPALAMGNTLVLKPASLTPLTCLEFAKTALEAGLPPGVLNVVVGGGATVGAEICESPLIDKISFTGSTEVGRQVQRMAAGNIKKLTLELGGKSPNVVLDDADVNMAVDGAIFAILFNNGQACEAGSRLLLHDSIHDAFLERMLERMKLVKVGDTLDFDTTVGPVVSEGQRKVVEGYIRSGVEQGAKLLWGGGRPEGLERGFFVEPTIFGNVTPEMRIFQEEIFGPVLSVTRFKSVDEAVALANDTKYGLAGAVWSRDIQRAIGVAKRIRAGTVWINDYHLLNPNAPFGGFKQSGTGHEMSTYCLKEYTEIQHLHVDQVGNDRGRKFWFDYVMNRPE
ncbi:MAG: aldehyde dehydrogenase family protein [Holophagales bacterium]|nr:aldehyde dehydrogenase family protein [Holophagales bacterium]